MSWSELLLSPANVVLKLAQTNQFDRALSVAQSLNVDMADIFTHLTMQCMRLARRPESFLWVALSTGYGFLVLSEILQRRRSLRLAAH